MTVKTKLGIPYRSKRGTKDYERENNLRKNYNITADEYDRLLAAQDGVCAICGDPPDDKPLCVDHNHECCDGRKSCGKCNRGILCNYCNVGIAQFLDDKTRLAKAIVYLEKY